MPPSMDKILLNRTGRLQAAIASWGRSACAGAALLLSACSTNPVIAPSEFPTPVLNRVPLAVGLYMNDALRNHVFVDETAGEFKQEVRVGRASESLFKEFLAAQFQRLWIMNNAPGEGSFPASMQAVLQPVIEEVQISSPKSDKDDFHEAWIKYRLLLMTPQGKQITSWEIAAYGKHRSAAIGGGNASLTTAVHEAMRDAAAGMALIFRDGEAIRQRILTQPPAQALSAQPAADPTP